MGNRYGASSDGSDGSSDYQDRRPDEGEREQEQQSVLGAFAGSVADQVRGTGTGLGGMGRVSGQSGDRSTSDTSDSAQSSTASSGTTDSSSSATGGSGSGSTGRGGGENASAAVSTALNTLISDTPSQMSAAQHRATAQVVEAAHDSGVDLAEGVDAEVHDWMTTVTDGNTAASEQTRDDVANLFIDIFL
jgi:hypothetical protein